MALPGRLLSEVAPLLAAIQQASQQIRFLDQILEELGRRDQTISRLRTAITAPSDLDVVAIGKLVDKRTRDGWTTWTWRAGAPTAPYLVGWTIGNYEVDTYRDRGISFVDAIDVDLFTPELLPVSGDQLAISGQADSSYKRIARTIAVPASGGELTFDVDRDTESNFDFFFVEAHLVGSDAWTTLPDLDGFAQQSTGFCALPFVHPFAFNYLSLDPDGPEPCAPTGLTGQWWAATGASEGWERWRIDLSSYAGQDVEIALTYASDDIVQRWGVAIDDVAFTAGDGTTSFEDGDAGGWKVPGVPPPTTVNENDWFVAGVEDLPPALGPIVQETDRPTPEAPSKQPMAAPAWWSTRWPTSGSETWCAWTHGSTPG